MVYDLQAFRHSGRLLAQGARLEQQPPASISAVEMLRVLPMPCLFTDHAGRCIEANQAFGRAAEGLALRVMMGRVRFADPDLQATFETALAETHTTAVGQVISTTAPNGKRWQVHLIPLRPVVKGGDAFDKKMILAVFEERTADMQPTPESLASTARLTPAEIEVLAGLLQGLSAKVIAYQRGASINTVRSQIMAILEKTGHNSQRELIASFGASSFGASTFGSSSFRASSN